MRSWQPDPAGVDPDEARRAADEILARPEYREPEPSLVDRVITAITDFLGNAFATLTGGGAGSVIGIVVVGALLALGTWLLVRAFGTGSGRRARPPGEQVVQGTSAPDDPEVWLAEAERLAAAGDHRGALRCRYQALVAGLVRTGAIGDAPARTPAELRRELAGRRPDVDPRLASITDRFESAWYGGWPVDATAYEAFAVDVRAVESADLRPVAVTA